MPSWSIVTTVKAPQDQILAFLAHHLDLGPAQITLLFDDPDDPAASGIEKLARRDPRIEVQRCTEDWWEALRSPRPERHQRRQGLNAHAAYLTCPSDWLLHIDIDEFLVTDRPVADLLATLAPARSLLRIAPWEALHDPLMAEDIFTARHFRRELGGPRAVALRAEIFGDYAPILPSGALSHAIGKCFFRTGIAHLHPWIHGATLGGRKMASGRASRHMALLHFHSNDPARWKAQLPFRLSAGAYVLKPEFQAWLQAATMAEIDQFYAAVLTATPEAVARLRTLGLLRETELHLRARANRLQEELR